MGHTVVFDDMFDSRFDGVVTRENVCDLIDLLFDGFDSQFFIGSEISASDTRGMCQYVGEVCGRHAFSIALCRATIEDHVKKGLRMGGNKHHKDLDHAVLSVLAHELQHANQHRRHIGSQAFYSGMYIGKPSERDARHFADQSDGIILQVLGRGSLESQGVKKIEGTHDVLSEIVEVFSFIDGDITTSEVIDELKCNDLNNAVNVNKVISSLKRLGKNVVH